MNKKTLQIVIVLLVLMNGVSLYFLFRPHPHHFRRPPSIVDVLNIEGESVSKIKAIEARLEFLKTDTTKWVSAFDQPVGCTPYDHGRYFRKLERNRLKAKLKSLQKKLAKN